MPVTQTTPGILRQIAPAILIITAAAVVGWIRLLPLSLVEYRSQGIALDRARSQAGRPNANHARSNVTDRQLNDWISSHQAWFDHKRQAAAARLESDVTYLGEDGKRHVYLGDADSYHWLRMARNYLRTGTTCDDWSDGECRDTFADAPVGRVNIYARSLHIAAIVLVHEVITRLRPGYPLAGSSYMVPVIVGIIGVLPAFAIGRALAGSLGGLFATLLIGLNPLLLQRTLGSDDDIWNIVLPLFMVWALVAALQNQTIARRIAYAVTASIFAALHATSWQGWSYVYLVALAGLAVATIVEVAGRVFPARSSPDDDSLASTLTVAGVFYSVTGLLTLPSGYDGFALPFSIVWRAAQSALRVFTPPTTNGSAWPQALATVAELKPMKLHEIVASVGGPVYFLAAYAGLLLLFMPKARLNRWHRGILISGLLIALLLTASGAAIVSPTLSIVLLAIPLCATIAASFSDAGANLQFDHASGFIIAIWFLSALALSFGGPRFAMLLVPSFAIAAGIFVGRLNGWLARLAEKQMPSAAGIARLAIAMGLSALVIPTILDGYRAARAYEPIMNSAWWDELTELKEKSPPDAIAYTFWDYGYWAKFVSERRVSADGGSLLTHIPYWFSRALGASSEKETVGLLRMLSCGSDATPRPEARQGAYAKLVKYGLGDLAARDAIVNLASLDRNAAAIYLTRLGLHQDSVNDVLTSTHCAPPPAYLILSSRMAHSAGFLSSDNTYSPNDYSAGRDIDYLMDRWRLCVQNEPAKLLCPLGVPINENKTLEIFTFDAAAPQQSRLKVRVKNDGGAAQELERTPAVIWLIEPGGIRRLEMPVSDEPDVGIIVDLAQHRILAGPPHLVRSTFTDLMFLNASQGNAFEKVDERTGSHDERVITWQIHWDQN